MAVCQQFEGNFAFTLTSNITSNVTYDNSCKPAHITTNDSEELSKSTPYTGSIVVKPNRTLSYDFLIQRRAYTGHMYRSSANTKLNIARGNRKTKSNFKLNILKTNVNRRVLAPTGAIKGKMKTKQNSSKDESLEKNEDDTNESTAKTRARKKNANEEGEKSKTNEADTEKAGTARRNVIKRGNLKKKVLRGGRPIGIQKTLRNKKAVLTKDKIKKVIKIQTKRGRPARNLKAEDKTASAPDEKTSDTVIIPASEIKKEPIATEELLTNSRSSSPKTTVTRRQRLTSDVVMMKAVLGDSVNSLVTGPRSPYSTRSDRGKSPQPAKPTDPAVKRNSLRNGKQRKLKGNLLNEIVKHEHKKRRLMSDSLDRSTETPLDSPDDTKVPRRIRSYSRDGSEISKCSDATESDLSFCDMSNDAESVKALEGKCDMKDSIKNLDCPKDMKTELELDNGEDLQMSTLSQNDKVPSNDDIQDKVEETQSKCKISDKCNDNLMTKRGTSIDTDNNNDNKNKVVLKEADHETKEEVDSSTEVAKLDSSESFDKSLILKEMSETFNDPKGLLASKIRRSKRQRKVTAKARPEITDEKGIDAGLTDFNAKLIKLEMLETLDGDKQVGQSNISLIEISEVVEASDVPTFQISPKVISTCETVSVVEPSATEPANKISEIMSVGKFYGLPDPKDKTDEIEPIAQIVPNETAKLPCGGEDKSKEIPKHQESKKDDDKITKKDDESEKLTLRFDDDEDSENKKSEPTKETPPTTYRTFSNQDIDTLMGKLKRLEELDKKKQLELRAKTVEKPPVLVTTDVVLIPKTGDTKPLKDLHPPTIVAMEKVIEKENVLSCFENNSAISIIKKENKRKSVDIDLPNSITLIKRSDSSSRKQSTGSSTSRDSTEALSIIEKSLGKDVTLEIRKSIEKSCELVAKSVSPKRIPSEITKIPLDEMSKKNIPSSVTKLPVAEVAKSQKNLTADVAKVSIDEINKKNVATNTSAPKIEEIPKKLMSLDISKAVSIENISKKAVSLVNSEDNSKKVDAPAITLEDIPKKITIPVSIPETKILKEGPPSAPAQLPVRIRKSTDAQILKEDPPSAPGQLPARIRKSTDAQILKENAPSVPAQLPARIRKSTDVGEDPPSASTQLPANTRKSTDAISQIPPSPARKSVETEQIDVKNAIPKKINIPVSAPVTKMLKEDPPNTIIKVMTAMTPEVKKVEELKPEMIVETPEKQRQKESILRTLGLLTLEAADKAKIEKLKQREVLANKGNKSTSGDYTGTLKTVIKLNRSSSEKKKNRSSLKMTFQKSKSRNSKLSADCGSGGSESDESPFYTIHKEGGVSSGGSHSGMDGQTGGHRKSHYSYRFNNHDIQSQEMHLEQAAVEAGLGKETSLNLVIPEKASSFSIHPGRLCQDQCFYCGGKFGLYDTPCHLAQMRSSERQKKILDNEEKLTKDSCLCDACYRHVDRRANCPSYRKRPTVPPAEPPSIAERPGAVCHAEGCPADADHSIRRKWLIKMRKSVNKVVQLELDYPGLHTIPLCARHYQAISHLMVCGLCTRRLNKHHNIHYVNQGIQALNPLLAEQGLPVVFEDKPVVCKMCRYFCTLLLRPSQQANQRMFMKSHQRRLLQAHNLEVPNDSGSEYVDDLISIPDPDKEFQGKQKKKNKVGRSKQRKSTESNKHPDENSSESNSTNQSHDKDTRDHSGNESNANGSSKRQSGQISNSQSSGSLEDEDIESLISSNKIPVPGSAASTKASHRNDSQSFMSNEVSDNSDVDMVVDYEGPAVPLDKQSELQYLLQKQNNPAQFLPKPQANLTMKSRNILKAHNASAIHKTSHTQKVLDKNAKRIQKLGQIITHKGEPVATKLGHNKKEETSGETIVPTAGDKSSIKDLSSLGILRNNIALNDECTIESLPPKKIGADINTLKNKWQMSESFSQVKKNLSELSKSKTSEQLKKQVSDKSKKYSNPVKRLETNPSISVRELFPGEEEMNLQCSIDFNNVKGVTPEGWEKCNTTIQYDTETRKLWSDLQKPYGNQSSFLRHLILLEKYFRNGDLVLSSNATSNATTYSDSVQSRLRSYDNIPSDNGMGQSKDTEDTHTAATAVNVSSPGHTLPETTITECPRKSETSVSLIEFRKQKNFNSGKSLLKTNQSGNSTEIGLKVPATSKTYVSSIRSPEITLHQSKQSKNLTIPTTAQLNQSVDQALMAMKLPRNVINKPPDKLTVTHAGTIPAGPAINRPPTPKPDFLKPTTELMKPPPPFTLPPSVVIEPKVATPKQDAIKPKAPSLPPELIAIASPSSQNRKPIENVLKSIQQLAKGLPITSSPTPPTAQPNVASTAQAVGLSPTLPSTNPPMRLDKPADAETDLLPPPPAKTDAPKKTKSGTKPWRPVLMPITSENLAKIAKEPAQRAVDGRMLPSLVQVLSGGKHYHITLQDYNKMCVMRREKLQQIQIVELLKGATMKVGSTSTTVTVQVDNSVDIQTMAQNVMDSGAASTQAVVAPITCSMLDNKTTMATLSSHRVEEKQAISQVETNAEAILKNVGLKNITIAPILSSASTDTKVRPSATVTSQSLLIAPSQHKNLPPVIAQLGSSVSVTTEAFLKHNYNISSSQLPTMAKPTAMHSQALIMPKIPKSLTVIPQTVPIGTLSGAPVTIGAPLSYQSMATLHPNPPKP